MFTGNPAGSSRSSRLSSDDTGTLYPISDPGTSSNRSRYHHGSGLNSGGLIASHPGTLPARLSWRSRSQPPFGDVDRSAMLEQSSPSFLNTESTQQMAIAGAEHVISVGPSSATRTSSYTTIGGSCGTSGRLRGSTNRERIQARPRTSATRRTLRTMRPSQYNDAALSSSSSNNSLVGRYRTISGVTTQDTINEQLGSQDTHLSHLLRFASLRLDTSLAGESATAHSVPLAMAEGSSDLDEFPALPLRTSIEQTSLPTCQTVNPVTCASRSLNRERPVSDGVVTGLLIDNCVDSGVRVDCISSVRTTGSVDTATVTVAYTSASQDLSSHSDHSDTGQPVIQSAVIGLGTNSEGSTTVRSVAANSSSFAVRFPMRNARRHVRNSSSAVSDATHQEPEADHDFYNTDRVRSPYRCNEHWSKILNGLNELRRTGQFCDVVLQAGSTKLPVHRNVLASSSQYFYAMFTGPMAEARLPCVQIQGVDEAALTQLIDFIYTGEITVTEDTVQVLLPAANLLQLISVRDACCEFLQSQLHPSNCLGIQRFADLHGCPDLLASSRRFTEQHFGELLQQDDEFLALSAEQLGQLISSDQLAVSEDQVFEAVLRWVAHDAENRQGAARSLCGRVRFALLPREYLVRLSQSEAFLSANPWCKDYLIEALSYHLLSWDQKLRVTSERAKPRTPVGLPKVLLVVGGQAPKAIRSVEYFEFRSGVWQSNNSDIGALSSQVGDIPHSHPSGSSSPSDLAQPSAVGLLPIGTATSSCIADLPSRRCRCGVAVVGGLVYVVGGFNGALRVRSVEVYDPVRNTWHSGPNMECRRATLGVAVLNGHIYAIGGFDGNAGLSSAEVFDIWSGNWRFIAPMSCRRSSVGAGALDGKIYAVGGYDGVARRCLASVECYDPVTNVWTAVADLTCRRSGPAVCELNNRLYAVGGHDGPLVRNTAEVYSPETDSWQRIADLNVQRRNAGLVVHDGFLYVVGGEDGEINLASVEKYDPSTNTWTLLASQMKLGRSYAGVAVIERNTTVS
ncbi:hypothetical protein P879_05402 [Paragonimus westermani]|uniref:BTB domain-containing protein n=1 Tax=Paragonimus westermani TaxID=34504 RepID=A0A8T0DMH3_9TREM|nr:hypothetical protein P879_05402 [Paragonimus westermani]